MKTFRYLSMKLQYTLTHLMLLVSLCNPWKYQETLIFRGFIKRGKMLEMDKKRRIQRNQNLISQVGIWIILLMQTYHCAGKEIFFRVCIDNEYSSSTNSVSWYFNCQIYQVQKQKQISRGVKKKRCSENMQQIYGRTSMRKSDFSKAALQLHWNHTSAWLFSCKFAAYFQNTFL